LADVLNASLLNAVGGASWVSVHHGGGACIGNLRSMPEWSSLPTETKEAEARLQRVLTYRPAGMGDYPPCRCGYDRPIENAKKWKP